MIIETAQLLSNCYSLPELSLAPKTQNDTVRKYSYPNHPCTLWAKESIENWNFLVDLGLCLQNSALKRGFKECFSTDFIKWCRINQPTIIRKLDFTTPPLCMPDEYKDDDPVSSYRKYYMGEKVFMKNGKRMDTWTNIGKPSWWII